MQRDEVKDLLRRYNAGICTDSERDLVESWYLQFEPFNPEDISPEERASDLKKISISLPVSKPVLRRLSVAYRYAAAAAVLLFLSLGIYYAAFRSPGQNEVIQTLTHNVHPGGNKATLTLSDGTQIMLTDAKIGKLADEGKTEVVKKADGKLLYTTASAKAGPLLHNVVTTPVGGTYDLTLADGTKVWLDAASSIRYPVAFVGKERNVEITGQAYFEVAHDASKPFTVSSKGQTVQVLGTHFNINAYDDENAITTTLLQGSVKVFNAGRTALLKPGQQSVIKSNDKLIVVSAADVETAIAWKQGLFRFRRADLKMVMNDFARWYNVQVVYEGKVPDVAITGKVLRSADAAQVLKIVNKLGIKFKAEGQKIVVLQE